MQWGVGRSKEGVGSVTSLGMGGGGSCAVSDNVAEEYEAVGPGRDGALSAEYKGVTSGWTPIRDWRLDQTAHMREESGCQEHLWGMADAQ